MGVGWRSLELTRPRHRPTWLPAGLAALLLGGGVLLCLLEAWTAFAADFYCKPGDEHCGLFLPAAVLPVLGWIGGLVAGGLLTRRAALRARSATVWIVAAWVLFAGCMVASGLLSRAALEQIEQEGLAVQLAQLRASPNAEVVGGELAQMQQRLRAELPVALPGLTWPPFEAQTQVCAGGTGPETARVIWDGTRITFPDAVELTDDQWGVLAAVVGRIAGEFGFPHAQLALRPVDGDPPRLQVLTDNGSSLSFSGVPNESPAVRVYLRTGCYLTATGRATVDEAPPPR